MWPLKRVKTWSIWGWIFSIYSETIIRPLTKMLEELNEVPLEEKEGLFSKLDTEIMKHADIEETYFYPKLQNFEDLAEPVRSALADHGDMREILQRMECEEAGSETWQTEYRILRDTVDDHVTMEEQEIFPRALRQMPGVELNRMREQVADIKEKSPQPHRHRDISPSTAKR